MTTETETIVPEPVPVAGAAPAPPAPPAPPTVSIVSVAAVAPTTPPPAMVVTPKPTTPAATAAPSVGAEVKTVLAKGETLVVDVEHFLAKADADAAAAPGWLKRNAHWLIAGTVMVVGFFLIYRFIL